MGVGKGDIYAVEGQKMLIERTSWLEDGIRTRGKKKDDCIVLDRTYGSTFWE